MMKLKKIKSLSIVYTILALLIFVIAGGFVLLPKSDNQNGIYPEKLLGLAISPERYISSDELAHKIISQDPSFLLIDVRDKERYLKYSLPNSINIPLENLLDEDAKRYLNQDAFDIILFSNDHFYSDQAWLLCKRLEYKNLRVLEGGINTWFNTVINPQKPLENQPASDFELYSFRKAASMYFGVVYPEIIKAAPIKKKVVPKKVVPVKKKKKMPVEGGC